MADENRGAVTTRCTLPCGKREECTLPCADKPYALGDASALPVLLSIMRRATNAEA